MENGEAYLRGQVALVDLAGHQGLTSLEDHGHLSCQVNQADQMSQDVLSYLPSLQNTQHLNSVIRFITQ